MSTVCCDCQIKYTKIHNNNKEKIHKVLTNKLLDPSKIVLEYLDEPVKYKCSYKPKKEKR
jgi:hypothetical protein